MCTYEGNAQGYPSVVSPAAVEGDDPYSVLAAAGALFRHYGATALTAERSGARPERSRCWSCLGWDTWDAFAQDVSLAGVFGTCGDVAAMLDCCVGEKRSSVLQPDPRYCHAYGPLKQTRRSSAVERSLSAWVASGAPKLGFIILDDGWQLVAKQQGGHARLAGKAVQRRCSAK